MAIRHLSHIGICVANLERSLVFYRDGLGFREGGKLDASGAPVDTLLELDGTQLHALYLERDGTRIELLYFSEPGHLGDAAARPMNQLGLTHLVAFALTESGDIPGGAAIAFWEPVKHTSIFHLSTSRLAPPSKETESTT